MLNCGFSEFKILLSWSAWTSFILSLVLMSWTLMNCLWTLTFLTYLEALFALKGSFKTFNMIPFCMVLCISFLVFYWTRYYMHEASSMTVFLTVLFSFVTSMLILILSESLLMVFLGWEGLGITSFILIIYYQNWSSFKGGLLTLLTNRLGDGVLMLCFSFWILKYFNNNLSAEVTMMFGLLFMSLTFTKSAQVPFTSWLPAAMAAPTPVSALVHSSTLVTAGVWLMIKFGSKSLLTSTVWLLLGIMTLILASMAAVVETDGKKIVALSTLSQLGLMFSALCLGGYFICLLHLVMHAFAKANLFLVVGNLIHSRFSLQDIRIMGISSQNGSLLLMMLISVFSLSGVIFTSGFFSKDYIMMSEFSILNSIASILILFLVISMTLIYCVKFMLMALKSNSSSSMPLSSVSSFLPSFVLSLLSVMIGSFFIKNLSLSAVSKMSGLYWMYLLLASLLLGLLNNPKWASLFLLQQQLIRGLNMKSMSMSKSLSSKTMKTLEGNYLTTFLFNTTNLFFSTRLIIVLSLSGIIFILLW